MQEVFDVYKIKFINKTDAIEPVEDGYSGALIYKVIRGENKYFLKIFKGILDIEKIKNYVSIYKKLNINSLDIIDYGNIDNLDKYYIIYNFIEGKNLEVYTNNDKYSLEDLRKIGSIIGKELLKLKTYNNYNNGLFMTDDINMIIEDTKNKFNLLLENEIYRNIMLEHFTSEEINTLNKKFVEYANIFKDIEPTLIHGDIKRSNM